MKIKKILALVLAMIMTLSLAACGDGSAQSTATNASGNETTAAETGEDSGGQDTAATEEDTIAAAYDGPASIVCNISADPQGFDVWTGSGSFQLKYLIYETLYITDYEGNNNPNPHIIKDVTFSDDGMSMDIEIYDDIHAQDGCQFKASDIIWSLESGLGANIARFVSVFDVPSCEATDDTHAHLVFADKWIDFNTDSLAMIYLACEESYNASPDHYYFTGLAGTGPYMVESYTEGNEVILVPNPDYDNRGSDYWGNQNLDRITCKVISESSQALIEYETGAIDLVTQPDLNDLEFYGSLEETDVINTAMNKNLCLCYNCSSASVLNNQKLREAISYAIDKDAIFNKALQGVKMPANGVTNPVCATYDPDHVDPHEYDIDKAKEMMKEAGYENGLTLRMAYSTSNGSHYPTMAAVIQNQLAEIGITIEIEPYDNATFSSIILTEDGWDITLTQYKSVINGMFHMWNLVNDNKKNNPFWEDSEFQDLLAKTLYSNDEKDIEKLVDMYEEACPYYTIGYETVQFIVRGGVEDVKFIGDNRFFPNEWNYATAEWSHHE